MTAERGRFGVGGFAPKRRRIGLKPTGTGAVGCLDSSVRRPHALAG